MKKIAVISHDAGGAEILSNWLREQKYLYATVLKGPATKIFKNNIKIFNNDLFKAIDDSELIMTGTSWQSDLEKEAIVLGRKFGKYTITFLDHWVNYEEKFTYKGKLTLPNEIWVTDKFAYELAKDIFKKTIIRMKPNYYLINLRKIIKKKSLHYKKNFSKKGLFLGENISEHAFLKTGDINGFGYTEIDSLRFLLENIENIEFNINSLKIRPHPSEKIDKYNWSRESKLINDISNENDLIDDILESEIIFGCESNAMIIGLLAGKKVISCIPNEKNKCSLPNTEIIYLRDLLSK